jgi:ligand-binding sensor domain-containing protein
MIKGRTLHYKINSFSSIILLILISSCNAQTSNGDLQNVISSREIVSQNSTLQINPINAQISQVVRTVFQDSKGDVWFGTQNGAFRLKGKSLTHIDGIKSESGKGVTIKDIAEDNDGKIWFGHTGGISVFDNESITNYYESDGLLNNDVWCISTDRNNYIWIGTLEGVCKFDGSHFTAFEIPEGKIDTTVGVSSTKMIHDIMEDSRGRMWFSTNGGVYIKDNDLLSNISEKDGLKTGSVNQVIEDKNGSFWISTPKGLFYLHGESLINKTEILFEDSIGTGSIVEDSKGNIWFNCSRSIYSLNGSKLTEYRIEEGNYGPLTFHIYQDRQKRLWFVGYGGAFRYENDKFLNITKNGPF